MRVLVTGASGFTGRYLMRALAIAGHEPLAFIGDLTDGSAVVKAVAGGGADAVVHLAALAFVHSDDFAGFYNVNQLGTYRLLDAVARHMPDAPVLIASSANIYGNKRGGTLSEDTAPDPINHYASSKYAMELGARLWADRLRLIVARPFNYSGIGQERRFLLPKIVEHFRQRRSVIELGNLDIARDFGDVRAVADAYVRLITNPRKATTVNICTGVASTISDIIAIATRETGHELKIRINPAFVRANEIDFLVGDNSRLRGLIPDWSPISIEQTISWMLEA